MKGLWFGPPKLLLLLTFIFQLSFVCSQAPTITKVSPAFASTVGGTLITVTGRGFANPPEKITCRFGLQTRTDATLDKVKGVVVCPSPPVYFIGGISLYVANGNAVSGSLRFDFTGVTPQLDKITPNNSLSTAATVITVSGKNFATGLKPRCVFAKAEVKALGTGVQTTDATVAAPDKATCNSPVFGDASQRSLTFQFTNDGIVFSKSLDFLVTAPLPVLKTINPGKGSVDKAIRLSGTNILKSSTGLCQVGGALVPAGYEDSKGKQDPSPFRIICNIPPLNNTRNRPSVEVRYTNDGITFSNPLDFTYVVPTPTISSLSKTAGRVGLSETITIYGRGFDTSSTGEIWCLFGEYPPVTATLTPSGSVTCNYPVVDVQIDLKVRVQNKGSLPSNGVLFSFKRPEFYYQATTNLKDPPVLTSISPAYSNVKGGGLVTINGRGFIESADGPYCIFGDIEQKRQTKGRLVVFKKDQQIMCQIPAAPKFQPYVTEIIVTNDGHAYSNSLDFRYLTQTPPL